MGAMQVGTCYSICVGFGADSTHTGAHLPHRPAVKTDASRGRDWVDVDKLNEFDPQSCAAYAQSIFQYLREAEVGPGRLTKNGICNTMLENVQQL